jgi:hypothetical protein
MAENKETIGEIKERVQRKHEPAPSTEERAESLLTLLENRAKDLGVGVRDIRPRIEALGFPHSELALMAVIAYVSGAITGGRLREELSEAYIRKPDQWQCLVDFALGLAVIAEEEGR